MDDFGTIVVTPTSGHAIQIFGRGGSRIFDRGGVTFTAVSVLGVYFTPCFGLFGASFTPVFGIFAAWAMGITYFTTR